jgi:hypothetical protein
VDMMVIVAQAGAAQPNAIADTAAASLSFPRVAGDPNFMTEPFEQASLAR